MLTTLALGELVTVVTRQPEKVGDNSIRRKGMQGGKDIHVLVELIQVVALVFNGLL